MDSKTTLRRCVIKVGAEGRQRIPCTMHLSKLTLTLLLLGFCGILVGFTFKINHLMGAEQVFNAGVFATVVGLLLAIRDVWKQRNT